jgi:hypothetical protein
MRRVIWPFLIWLLALALPAQGLAAATMLHCAPAGSGAAGAAAHGSHGHDASAAHHHDTATADDTHSDAAHHVAAADRDFSSDTPSPAVHKCSACAACNVGLGLPSQAYSTPGAAAATAVLLAPVAPHVAFFTSGPDRPPRALLP